MINANMEDKFIEKQLHAVKDWKDYILDIVEKDDSGCTVQIAISKFPLYGDGTIMTTANIREITLDEAIENVKNKYRNKGINKFIIKYL